MSCVVVFGREPLPGSVKTRLASSVGEEAAAVVYRELLAYTLEMTTAADMDVLLALAEPPLHDFQPPVDVAVEIQPSGDLGRRLEMTFERRFDEGYRRVVVIGSDCPELDGHHLVAARDGLGEATAVIGPAEDGGYWLIGLGQPVPGLFDRVPWSTAGVLDVTRARLRALELDWVELDTLFDLDSAEDLTRTLSSGTSGRCGARLRSALAGLELGLGT